MQIIYRWFFEERKRKTVNLMGSRSLIFEDVGAKK